MPSPPIIALLILTTVHLSRLATVSPTTKEPTPREQRELMKAAVEKEALGTAIALAVCIVVSLTIIGVTFLHEHCVQMREAHQSHEYESLCVRPIMIDSNKNSDGGENKFPPAAAPPTTQAQIMSQQSLELQPQPTK